MKIGKLAYKMGFSFTKWESRLQNKNFTYQMGFLAYKWDSQFAIHPMTVNTSVNKSNYNDNVLTINEFMNIICSNGGVYYGNNNEFKYPNR